ncbi:MAG: hypothetical protein IT324_11130 [Anaerolineae bacterium]|nr:hypothetical protein [Anaerolineae bacterium]
MSSPTSDPPDSSAAAIEQITPHISLEWLFERRGFAITIHDGSRETVDAWFETVKAIALDWHADQLFLSLYDFSYPNIAMSPYARSRSEALRDLRPELNTRTAVVLHNSLVVQLAQFFIVLGRRDSLVARIFTNRPPAIDWLRREMAAAHRL